MYTLYLCKVMQRDVMHTIPWKVMQCNVLRAVQRGRKSCSIGRHTKRNPSHHLQCWFELIGSLGGKKGESYKLNYGYLTNTRSVVISRGRRCPPTSVAPQRAPKFHVVQSSAGWPLNQAPGSNKNLLVKIKTELSPKRFGGVPTKNASHKHDERMMPTTTLPKLT